MSDFYTEMAGAAREMLAPTDEGGLGQGKIELVRLVPGASGPNPWSPPPAPVPQTTPLDGAASGVAKDLVGLPVETGGQIVATDVQVIVSVPANGYNADAYEPTDILKLDGKPVTILRVKNIPAVGTVCAIQFVARR